MEMSLNNMFFSAEMPWRKTLSLCSSVKTIRSTAIVTCRAEHQGCSSSSATKSSRWGSWNTCEPREVLRRASKMGTFSHGAWCRTIWGEYTALWKIIVFKSNLRWFIHCEVYNVIFMQCGASLNTPDGLQDNRLETPSVCFAAFVVVCFSTASPDQSFHADSRDGREKPKRQLKGLGTGSWGNYDHVTLLEL